MRHPPEALYSFTIPSVHDDTALNCRVFHPDTLKEAQWSPPSSQGPARMRGIIMAHPYAPMGGSYDDRVVSIVLDEFLKAGWIVGTFNFRGAHGSKGRTSWTGRPELDDYTSFAAFFIHYVGYIRPQLTFPAQGRAPLHYHSVSISSGHEHTSESPIIILGGYSYGSLILRHLPPVPSILHPFMAPIAGSAHDEILLRARKLADQSNTAWRDLSSSQERASRSRNAREQKSSLNMGGEETTSGKRRRSREVRRSTDRGLSTEFGDRLRDLSHDNRKSKGDSPSVLLERAENNLTAMPEVRYLLISPLSPPTSTLAAPALGHRSWHKPWGPCEEVVGQHATLAIYGDRDIFTSAKRIRDWTKLLSTMRGSRFSSVEVAGAGHFWVEGGVEDKLRCTLREWEAQVR